MARPPRRASTTGDRTGKKETEETLCASPPVVVFRLLLLASGTPAYVAMAAGRWLQTLLRLERTVLPDQAAAKRRQTDPERENYRTADCDRSRTGLTWRLIQTLNG